MSLPQFHPKWAPLRHTSQAVLLLLFFLLPLPLPFEGAQQGLLKVDFNTWRVSFFGLVLVPGTLHILFFALLLPIFAIALASKLYGKVFCGWACPQNIFYELFSFLDGSLKKRFPYYRKHPRLQKILDFLFTLSCGWIISSVALFYFVGLHPIAEYFLFFFIFGFFVVDMYWLKHRFCKHACPYSLIQKAFQDQKSMHVQWENRPGNFCGTCQACEKACYVDINIRQDPLHMDCTNCGACIDACSRVFHRRPASSLLRFSFEDQSPEAPRAWLGFNSSSKIFLGICFLLYCIYFTYQIAYLPQLNFRIDYPVGGTAQQVAFIENESVNNSFTLRIRNFSSQPLHIQAILKETNYQVLFPQETANILEIPAYSKRSIETIVRCSKEYANSQPAYSPIQFKLIDLKTKKELASQSILFKKTDK